MSDTPRTDAKSVDHIGFYSCATVTSDFARQLERELAVSLENQCKAQAEVARLNNILENTRMSKDTMIEDRNLLDQELAASKAEVERLRAFIKSKLPPPPYGELEPEWKYAEKLLAETAPEWRELGPDEEIHTGDQVQAKHHDRIHGVWLDVFPYEVGAMPIDHEAFRYRTRRPLPVQEMPLEDELKRIEWYQNYSEVTIYHALADALRYLRDEIEALKKNQK